MADATRVTSAGQSRLRSLVVGLGIAGLWRSRPAAPITGHRPATARPAGDGAPATPPGPRHRRVPRVPGRQRVEHGRSAAPRRFIRRRPQIIATSSLSAATACTPTSAGTAEYGIPFIVVPADPAAGADHLHRVRRRERPRSVPDPARTRRSKGDGSDGDRHVLVVQQGTLRAFELFVARRTSDRLAGRLGRQVRSQHRRASPARLDQRRRRRPADPARSRPLRRGAGRVDRPRDPGRRSRRRSAGSCCRRRTSHRRRSRPDAAGDGHATAAEGRATTSPASTGQSKVIATAMQRYGLIVADNGSNWFFQGSAGPPLERRRPEPVEVDPGTAFEVVDTGDVQDS